MLAAQGPRRNRVARRRRSTCPVRRTRPASNDPQAHELAPRGIMRSRRNLASAEVGSMEVSSHRSGSASGSSAPSAPDLPARHRRRAGSTVLCVPADSRRAGGSRRRPNPTRSRAGCRLATHVCPVNRAGQTLKRLARPQTDVAGLVTLILVVPRPSPANLVLARRRALDRLGSRRTSTNEVAVGPGDEEEVPRSAVQRRGTGIERLGEGVADYPEPELVDGGLLGEVVQDRTIVLRAFSSRDPRDCCQLYLPSTSVRVRAVCRPFVVDGDVGLVVLNWRLLSGD